jgi:hypothetical protein
MDHACRALRRAPIIRCGGPAGISPEKLFEKSPAGLIRTAALRSLCIISRHNQIYFYAYLLNVSSFFADAFYLGLIKSFPMGIEMALLKAWLLAPSHLRVRIPL